MKKVLLFEDNANYAINIMLELKNLGYEVDLIASLPNEPENIEFRQIVDQANQFDLVIWDNYMQTTDDPNRSVFASSGYIGAFKKAFGDKPMIANSSNAQNRASQMEVGCTHEAKDVGDIKKLAKLVHKILK
jgi:hypothetical protein